VALPSPIGGVATRLPLKQEIAGSEPAWGTHSRIAQWQCGCLLSTGSEFDSSSESCGTLAERSKHRIATPILSRFDSEACFHAVIAQRQSPSSPSWRPRDRVPLTAPCVCGVNGSTPGLHPDGARSSRVTRSVPPATAGRRLLYRCLPGSAPGGGSHGWIVQKEERPVETR
jgi:hypothetical protein